MSNEYQEAIGNWEHKIGKITHIIVPEEDDNYAFLRAKDEAQKADSSELLHKRIGELYFNMVLRSKPNSLPKDGSPDYEKELKEWQAELKKWISLNINQIIEDFMVAMKWTTEEKLSDMKGKIEKKLEAGDSPKIQ